MKSKSEERCFEASQEKYCAQSAGDQCMSFQYPIFHRPNINVINFGVLFTMRVQTMNAPLVTSQANLLTFYQKKSNISGILRCEGKYPGTFAPPLSGRPWKTTISVQIDECPFYRGTFDERLCLLSGEESKVEIRSVKMTKSGSIGRGILQNAEAQTAIAPIP